ncbi:Molybdate-anion transporter [Lachnellula hyalina]|uniref:Molybdate-anion transporter n=1 Tax=Lachnellula hyalina TaxID=1316788 RepID=A0A8H8R0F7_9HELO|nr:Molybdate-anion transporter [Lachnellula hyalina]TVY26148.1 Molybdate-anion transporter [Lachnellula hyalina]
MAFYEYNVLVLVVVVAGTAYLQHRRGSKAAVSRSRGQDGEATRAAITAGDAVIWQFKKKFLPVYLLAFGSDWLQGPYIYTMYKDEKGLPEETVAYLFATGFLAAAISASFVGSLADRYGRRSASLFFCVAYALSCFTVLFDSIFTLFAGRILGGLSTTLLWSVIESWMVTEFHRQHLEEAGSLSDIFGIMTTLNGAVAILAGLFAQTIADVTKTQAAPFMAAVVLLILAFGFISSRWSENYGDSHKSNVDGLLPGSEEKEKNGLQYILQGRKSSEFFEDITDCFGPDKHLWALCITSSCFEGVMYLWIFFKFAALKLSHEAAGKGSELPFGTIFAALMCAMMLGSLSFTYYSSLATSRWVVSPSRLLTITLFVASACFILPVLVHDEAVTFWCFCVFEICCGIYFPSIARLKEQIVEDGVRAKIYGILRIPLNIFVVLGLMLTKAGKLRPDPPSLEPRLRHRENVFIICSGALAAAAAALGAFVAE